MKLVKLNTALIATALQQHEETGTPVPFNTSFHPESSAPDLTCPSEKPYSFKRWLPLILHTREQTTPPPARQTLSVMKTTPTTTIVSAAAAAAEEEEEEEEEVETPHCPPVQTICVTLGQTKLLLAATEASLPAGHLNRLYREDLADELAPLFHSTLIFPPEGLFLRLDEYSPKDGAGPLVLRTVEDVLRNLVTSVRARNALVHSLDDEDGGEGVELFFLPFDERMAGDREYRVFCRPGDGRVCAISQYRWHRSWRFQGVGEAEQERVVRRVWEGAEEVRSLLLGEVAKGGTEEDKLLGEQGFSFDLFYDEDANACSLVELNTFGGRSACGSCLFQWADDRKVLYGEEEAQFRVSVNMGRQDGDQMTIVCISRLESGEGGNESSEFRGRDWRGFIRVF
ncbi:hypothetical protein C8A03DRAFT_37724 [Achaetomium macrosporum]|uniref:Cell division cycle protein 123 n=1 Tax=Achaetomium macrosporum TaxID=79813 RepID=A0AAN7HAW3_9PEZI|nr:hypothetical protein C8A03DRAFT_37724 [Achaetomium macrosporum]